MPDHNIILQLPDGTRKPSGKVVRVDGENHMHVTAQSGWRLISADAWGIQEDVLHHCRECDVTTIHVYDRGENATYSVALADLDALAVSGYDRAWGQMRNLAARYWTRTYGRVEAGAVWVPDQQSEVVLRHAAEQLGLVL